MPAPAFPALAQTTAELINRTDEGVTGTDLIVIAGIIVTAAVLTKVFRPLVRRTLTGLARRSLTGTGTRWRTRSPRVFGETAEQAELRRQQRIAATATGLSRVFTTLLWILALLLVLQQLDIDPVFAISAAGFLGVAISVGGQHSVNDFLTGLHILIEDRFGEGDRLEIDVHDGTAEVTVAFLGAFATRLEGENGTYHVPNREMMRVLNLSQRGSTAEVDFQPSTEVPAVGSKHAFENAVRSRYTQTNGFDASRDGLVVDAVEEGDNGYVVKIRTARPLSPAQRDALARGADQNRDY